MKRFLRSNVFVILSCLAIAPVAGTVFALATRNDSSRLVSPSSEAAIASTDAVDLADETHHYAVAGPIASSSPSSNEEPILIHPSADSTENRESQHIAQESDFNCDNPQYQLEMTYCAGLDHQRADDALNLVYRDLLAVVSDARRQKLIDAELAWIQYRDATCEFERSQYAGGSIEPMIYNLCMARLTEEQTQQLEIYLEEQNR
ncbi:MAG: lysozyme inhibitor LprI family protein [Cyanobacteria bacterium J06633_2]